MHQAVLFTAQTSNGNGQTVKTEFDKPQCEFHAWGVFGGGTVQLQQTQDGGQTWWDVEGASLTASGTKEVEVAWGDVLRATLTGATNPNVSANIRSLYK